MGTDLGNGRALVSVVLVWLLMGKSGELEIQGKARGGTAAGSPGRCWGPWVCVSLWAATVLCPQGQEQQSCDRSAQWL